MLNNPMQNQHKIDLNQEVQAVPVPRAPNESGQLHIDDFVKISDPNTQEVLLEKRS